MMAVFDLDDTLACTKHRRHLIIPEGSDYATYDASVEKDGFVPDWDTFFAARYDDEPIWPTIQVFKALERMGVHCEIWTAAREDSREVTKRWLHDKCFISSKHLTHMRAVGDYRHTVKLKETWLLNAKVKPSMFFDDHIGIIRMARSHGVIGFAVGEMEY